MARVIGTGIDPTTYKKKKKTSTSRVVGSGVNSVNYPAAQQTTQPANTLSPMTQATLQQAAQAAQATADSKQDALTAAQLAACNSGITAAILSDILSRLTALEGGS